MDNYSKYKEQSPEDTVLTVQSILNRIGIFPVLRWSGEDREGFYSNRITLHPTSCGVNGKGRDELYCSASAYGELMERLQNNILITPPMDSEAYQEAGFYYAPDEEEMPLEEILAHPDPFTAWVLSLLEGEDEFSDGKAFLKLFSFNRDGTDCLKVIPFADPANNRIVKVPSSLAINITGSNGMAAGNTIEEAMVQGLSELFEREANMAILAGEGVPPEIPDEALEPYDFFEQIKYLRSDKHVRVSVLDCSMGKEWPVVAFCINDLVTGTFGIQVGAHPSFPVAVERTLTEAAQGQKLVSFISTNHIGSPEAASCSQNRQSILKTANGYYPASIFAGEPGWMYRPWTRFHKTGNPAFLAEMIRLLNEDGYQPLFRDVSFLGFPACYMLVPGFRTPADLDGKRVRRKRTEMRAASDWDHFPHYGEEEAVRLLRLVRFHKNTPGYRIFSSFCSAPLSTPDFSNARFGACLSLMLGDFAGAEEYLKAMYAAAANPKEQQYIACMRRYANLSAAGMKREEILRMLGRCYMKEAVRRVADETADRSKILEKCFRKPPCPNCDTCSEKGKNCRYEDTRKMYINVSKAMKKENVSQERLLALLRQLSEL